MNDGRNRYIGDLMIRNLEILRKDLAMIPEKKLWLTYPGITNSFGNLVLHICGNLNHFIGRSIGGTDYVRDRDAEFSQKDIPADKLEELISETAAMLRRVLKETQSIEDERTLEIAGNMFTLDQALIYLTNHQAYHTGQANYIARISRHDQ